MKEKNEVLYEKVEKAIKALFADESVDKTQTVANLEELMGDIQIMLDNLEEEVR